MSISSINNLFSQDISSVLSTALQTSNAASNSIKGINGQRSDSSQLSPLAQLLSTLQQLQQSDPAKYKQVTAQISTNLQNAAQTAQSNGNTTAANELNQLATDFTSAASSGQLPNIQDLAKAIGGGGGGHRHHVQASGDADGDASSTSQSIQQLLAAFQASGSQSGNSLSPLSIILNTLKTSGITPTSKS
jgi:alanyl-tRNA synthetase